jgi:glycosyltransferase involved in cell wall biosynthesis
MNNQPKKRDSQSPTLSIGLPVYNGERHIEHALQSFLAQTYTDFEIVICDNASSDATEEICRRYVERDARVRYHRNERNVGAAPNFNLAFERAAAPYFKWAAHDDICLPDYLEACMDVMLRDPSVVLCHSEIDLIDDAGEVIRAHSEELHHTDADRPSARFRDLIFADSWCIDVFGVIRRDALATTPLIASYVGSDRVLLAELGLHGRFYRVPRTLFQNRDHPRRSVHSTDIRSAERMEWFDPSHGGASPAPTLRCWYEFGRSANRVPVGLRERLRCYKALVRWLPAHRWWVRADLEHTARHVGRRAMWVEPSNGACGRVPAERARRLFLPAARWQGQPHTSYGDVEIETARTLER